jgi:hypothetical protein
MIGAVCSICKPVIRLVVKPSFKACVAILEASCIKDFLL